MELLCPCGTGKKYSSCCRVYHEGAYPDNALLLMRSRYSAYACQLPEYIIRTTHPNHPHYTKRHDLWTQDILHFCQTTQFQQLDILEFIDGAEQAYVTFNAHLIQNQLKRNLIEKSYFEKVGNEWLYKNGIFVPE